MEFRSLKNIETSFRQIRLFGIVFVAMCAVVVSVALVMVFNFAEKQREKIYVLDNGKSLMLALSQDMEQNRPAEAREHVRRFHELFFNLSPIIAGNFNQVVQVDSVICDFNNYPYTAKTYAKQMIIRESNVTQRTLVTTCRLSNVSRSDDNPNGFIIEGFNIIENRDIITTKR